MLTIGHININRKGTIYIEKHQKYKHKTQRQKQGSSIRLQSHLVKYMFYYMNMAIINMHLTMFLTDLLIVVYMRFLGNFLQDNIIIW